MSKIQKLVQNNVEGRKLEADGEVCTSLLPPQRAPWLAFFSHGKDRKLQTFVSLSEERVHVRDREEMHQSCLYASCSGWLFMTDLSHRSCFLLNLLSMRKIKLPSPRGSNKFKNAVITSSPLSKGSSMILCYRGDKNIFLFHSLEEDKWEDKWEVVNCDCEDGLKWLLECDGVIYAPTEQLDLAIVDVVAYPTVRPLDVRVPMAWDTLASIDLVESCGQLFATIRSTMTYINRFHSVEVFRMDFSEMRWVKVSSLGDRAFFIGTNARTGISCSASRAGIEANCIYFVDSDNTSILKFDMADNSVTTEMSLPEVSEPSTEPEWINILES